MVDLIFRAGSRKKLSVSFRAARSGRAKRVEERVDKANLTDGDANIRLDKSRYTRVENWYQATGNVSANLLWFDRWMKGRPVNGADKNTNVNKWHFGPREDIPGERKVWETNANVGHGGIYENPEVRAEVRVLVCREARAVDPEGR